MSDRILLEGGIGEVEHIQRRIRKAVLRPKASKY